MLSIVNGQTAARAWRDLNRQAQEIIALTQEAAQGMITEDDSPKLRVLAKEFRDRVLQFADYEDALLKQAAEEREKKEAEAKSKAEAETKAEAAKA